MDPFERTETFQGVLTMSTNFVVKSYGFIGPHSLITFNCSANFVLYSCPLFLPLRIFSKEVDCNTFSAHFSSALCGLLLVVELYGFIVARLSVLSMFNSD